MGYSLVFFAIGFYISSDVAAYLQLEEVRSAPKILIYARATIAVIAIIGTILMTIGVR